MVLIFKLFICVDQTYLIKNPDIDTISSRWNLYGEKMKKMKFLCGNMKKDEIFYCWRWKKMNRVNVWLKIHINSNKY
jgi:hypothetical protein